MVETFRVVFTAALVLSGLSTAVLAVFSYRHRETPGAVPFAGLAAMLAHWSLVYAVAIQVHDEGLRIALLQVQWLAHPTVPLFLFLFGLSYTGHDELVTRRTVPLIAAIPVTVVLAAWTNPLHHLLWTDQAVHVVDGMAVLVPTYGPLFWINIVYGYGIEFVAIAVLIRLVYDSEYLYADQSALLLVGIAIPLVANVHEIFIVGATPAVDWTPISFAASGLAFGYAVFRRQLFDLIPATRTLGRDAAISQLDTGIVIVDDGDRVVYANSEAGEIFDVDPREMLGRPSQAVVDDAGIDFDAPDALAEIDRDGHTYEVRTSPITDRSDREIGHTLVFHDVTARKERERELSTVNDLNGVIRAVNQALVSATSRAEIERAVCSRLADADLYDGVCVADLPTWAGEADRWHVAGDVSGADDGDDEDGPTDEDDADGTADGEPAVHAGAAPPEIRDERIRTADGPAPAVRATTGDDAAGDWLVVPVVYGRTVYGAIGLRTSGRTVSEREETVLGELGELVGHAINAIESRRLFAAEGVVELTVAVDDADDPIAAATADGVARLDVVGVVPGGEAGHHAFLAVTDGGVGTVRDRLTAAGCDVRIVREDGQGGLLDVALDGETSLGVVAERDAQVLDGRVADGTATFELLVPTAREGRTVLDHLSTTFAGTDLRSKRDREHPFEAIEGLSPARAAELTDRQREALAAAYRAGYFEWPREADAESVAESMDIASSTLHAHLRKAQQTLLADLFEDDEPGEH